MADPAISDHPTTFYTSSKLLETFWNIQAPGTELELELELHCRGPDQPALLLFRQTLGVSPLRIRELSCLDRARHAELRQVGITSGDIYNDTKVPTHKCTHTPLVLVTYITPSDIPVSSRRSS